MMFRKFKNKNKSANDSLRRAVVILALFLVGFFIIPSQNITTNAASESEIRDQLNDIQSKINDTNALLKQKRAETASLQNEVAIFDSQIYQIELQIQSTESQINLTANQIEELNVKIKETEAELAKQKEILNEYLRVIYEEGQVSVLEQIASSNSFSDFVDRAEYLQTMQLKIKEAVEKIKILKAELEAKKNELVKKSEDLENLKKQQVSQKQGLDSQRAAKQSLLDKTRGEEAAYQGLLKDAKDQFNRMQQELWAMTNDGNFVSLGSVARGDIIGYIGNTGYSTGCHLHFEIRITPSQHDNPDSYIGNGYFIKPVNGVSVNVPYGYSSFYFSGVFHTGIDYADGCAGTSVRAAADGEIIKRVTGRPNTYPWSYEYGNFVMIKHTNGMYSLYGHLR